MALTPEQMTALRAECQADPMALGLAPLFVATQDQAVTDRLNSLTGPGAAVITTDQVSKGAFLIGIASGAVRLAGLTTALQSKWDRIIGLVTGAGDTILVTPILGVLALAVADGVLLQTEIDAFTKRTGSRAEVLWGAGTVIATTDVGGSRP